MSRGPHKARLDQVERVTRVPLETVAKKLPALIAHGVEDDALAERFGWPVDTIKHVRLRVTGTRRRPGRSPWR